MRGAQVGAALHMARAVARRAERKVVALSQCEEVPGEALAYLNRLSDLLFMMARAADEMPCPPESLG
jgi:cob(I)alamin adenosyltransferase